MSIIAVNGSPRVAGNTMNLIGEVISAAEAAGGRTQLLQLGKLNISPCTACMGCKETAKCAVRDDMVEAYKAIDSAAEPKGLIIGTPIYFDHITAQLKTWIDRLYCYTYTRLGQRMFPKGFRAVLVATYDAAEPKMYDAVLDWLAGRLEYYHRIETIARIVQPSATEKPLDRRADLIKKAQKAGKRLAGK